MGLYNIQQSAKLNVKNGLCLCDALQVEANGIIKAILHCAPKFLKSSPSFQNTSNQIKWGKQGWRLFVHHPVSASLVLILLPVSLSAHILGSASTLHAYSKGMEKKGGKQLKRHYTLANLEHYTVDKAKLMQYAGVVHCTQLSECVSAWDGMWIVLPYNGFVSVTLSRHP